MASTTSTAQPIPPVESAESARVAAAPAPSRSFTGGRQVLVWAALALLGVVFTYPLVWLVSASLKPRGDVFDNRLLPRTWAPENYVQVWDEIPLFTWLVNSIVVGVAAAAAVTVSSALVAFGFSYYRFPGRRIIFALVLGSMMLPAAVTLVPTYLIWNEIGLATTQVPLWAGNLFGSAFYIFLLRQFFRGLPREMYEAAEIDGCNAWGLFWRITVPLSKPALLITFIFEFQASWMDLLKPLVYLREEALFTLPRGLKAVLDQFGQGGERQWEIVLAANVVATIPMVILFIVAGRWITQGITFSGRED
jgi:multiple sugar transport system permease protein